MCLVYKALYEKLELSFEKYPLENIKFDEGQPFEFLNIISA